MKDKNLFYPLLNFVPFFLICFLVVKVFSLHQAYQKVLAQRQAVEKQNGIIYKIILRPGSLSPNKPNGILLIGDLLGTNFRSAERLAGDFVLNDFPGMQVIVPTVNPSSGLGDTLFNSRFSNILQKKLFYS